MVENKLLIENKKSVEVVCELKENNWWEKKPVKKSNLSKLAQSLVKKKFGSSYISENQEVYGPCPENWFDNNTGDYVRTTVKIREFRLKISITGGTWWYYTDDKTAGVGGESSWWDICGFWTRITQFGDSDKQWKTDQMLIKNIHDARKTLRAFDDERIIVVNSWGCDSENSRIVKRNTIRDIEWAVSRWESGESINENMTA